MNTSTGYVVDLKIGLTGWTIHFEDECSARTAFNAIASALKATPDGQTGVWLDSHDSTLDKFIPVCPSCGGTGLPSPEEFAKSAVQHGYNCPTCGGEGRL